MMDHLAWNCPTVTTSSVDLYSTTSPNNL